MEHVELVICTLDGRALGRLDLGGLFGRVVIGRAEDCDVRLASPSVSRHHCALEQDEDGAWQIRDLGSRAGTLIDGVHVPTAPVAPGLRVQIGPALLRFEAVHAQAR